MLLRPHYVHWCTMKTNRRIPLVFAPVLILLVGLLMSCGLGSVALSQGMIEPPALNWTINGVGLVAKTTNVPSCPIWLLPCGRVRHLAANETTYAMWFVWEPAKVPVQVPGARRLFAMRLVRS